MEKDDLAKLYFAVYFSALPFVVYKHLKHLEEAKEEIKPIKVPEVEEPKELTIREFIEALKIERKGKKIDVQELIEFLLRGR